MQRVKPALVCLSWLFWASAVSAQTAVDPTSSPGVAAVQNVSGGGLIQGTYFDVRHVVGDGVGYTNSYSQVGMFTPFWVNENAFIAPNTRLLVTNSTQVGVSTGLVGRQYVDNWDRIVGAYGYYDSDQDSYNNRYSQFTVGAETLGQWWDLRANGYFLNGNNDTFIAAQGIGGNPFYLGHNIDFMGTALHDQSLGGGDAEFGIPVSAWTPWLRAYSGVYGYHSAQQHTFGYRGRVEAMISNDLTLGGMVSQDPLWGTNVNLTVDFKFSGFQPTRYYPNLTTFQRMLNPVQRNWRVSTHTYSADVDIAAINPRTNQPYFVTHVDNSAPAGGNGTIEHPFNFLPSSAPGDIILVHLGNSTLANPVAGSIALSDFQRVLGTGVLSTVNLFAQYGPSTISGTYNLPQTSNSGLYPFVSSSGNIITLANNNEVAGLNLMNAGGSAITNTVAGSNNFLLHNLEISNNAGTGIGLANASGTGTIFAINQGTTNSPNPNGYGSNAGGGISISTGAPGLNLSLTDVNMNATVAAPQPFGVQLIANNGPLNADLTNVNTNGNGTGIQLSELSQQMTVNMSNVRASNNAGVGIQVQGTGGAINLNMNNVAAMTNASDNLEIGTQISPIVTSTVNVNAVNTNFSGSTGGSGVVFSQSGGLGTLTMTGGTIVQNNFLDGMGIFGTNNTVMNANVVGGTSGAFFANNGRDAFHVEGTTGATINLFVDPTNASGSGRDGLYYNMDTGSQLNTTFLNDNLNNSGQSAVYGLLTNGSGVNLLFNNTTGQNSGINGTFPTGDGFYLNAQSGSTAQLEIDNGNFGNSGVAIGGSSGINIISDNSTIGLTTDFTSATNTSNGLPGGIQGNQSFGVSLNLADNSVFVGNMSNSDFSSSLVNSFNINVNSGSNAMLTLLNVTGNASGADGVVVNVNNANLVTTATNVTFNNSVGNGMNFTVANGGSMTSSFDNSQFNNSGADGILGVVNGVGSAASLSLIDASSVSNSQQDGINFNVSAGSLAIHAYSSSISNNGLGGSNGSGVLGVITNAGLATLDFANAAINFNLDNGVFVTANTLGNIQASFDLGTVSNNGTTAQSIRGNDGILINVNDSPNSFLQVYNGAVVNGNGNDGVAIVASNGSVLNASFGTDLAADATDLSTLITNNGTLYTTGGTITAAGLNVTSQSSSTVNMTANGVTIGNTVPGALQQVGFLFDANSAGVLNASFQTGFTTDNLSNNAADAVNGTVDGAGSIANVSLVDVAANNSGVVGGLFSVTNGGSLNVFGSVNTSFSNSGSTGILVLVDGANSFANFDFDTVAISNNGASFGGQGFSGVATNGGTLNTLVVNSTFNANANQGIQLTASDPNSTMNFHVQTTNVNSNGDEGLLINVANLAQVNYRSVGSTYDSNGNRGALDGISVTATGNGPANSATALLLFSGGSANSNTGDGLDLTATNGATLTTSIENGFSASNNAKYGVQATASGANTSFNLLMNGANTFTGNGLGAISPLVFSNMNQVVLEISGSFNNSTGDGISVNLQNVANSAVAIEGADTGTINGSAGNGINIQIQNTTATAENTSVLIDGFTSINNSGLNGININITSANAADPTNAAVQISGTTTGSTAINASGGDAINENFSNVTLVNPANLNVGTESFQVLTLVNNLNDPLHLPAQMNNRLPVPVTTSLNALGITPVNALVIDHINATGSGNTGFNIVGNNTTIAANGSFITNNVVASSTGDGLHLSLTNGTADNLTISGNGFQSNTGNGINLELFNTPINGLTITNNTGGTSLAAGTLNFVYTNANAANAMSVTTTGGLSVASVSLNIAPSLQFFRPDLTPVNPPGFLPTAPTDVTVGLDSVDGVAVVAGNYPVQDTMGNVLPFGGVALDSQQLTLGFSSFTTGTVFQYSLAHGQQSTAGNALGTQAQLVGSTGTVTLADGRVASGVFTAAGLQINQIFAATATMGISGNGLDGIRMNLNSSSLTNLNVSGNLIENNGTTGSGNGVEFTGAAGSVANSDITNAVFNTNTITGNAGNGIRLINPQTVGNTVTANFTGNTIGTNTGAGINMKFNANTNFTGNFATNTISSNGAQGVNLTMGTGGVLTSDFTGNTINGNTGDGIAIALGTGGNFTGTNFYGNTIGTAASHNGGMGVRLTVPDTASFNWNVGNAAQAANLITGNTAAGIGILMTGASTGTLNVVNSTFSNTLVGADPNFNGMGLGVVQQGSSTLTGSITQSTFTSNAGDGAFFSVTGNNAGIFASLNGLVVGGPTLATGNTFKNNGGSGLEFFRNANGEIGQTTAITIQNNVLDNNSQNGLQITAANQFQTDQYVMTGNDFSSNLGNGLLFSERADGNISANMSLNTFTNNGNSGIRLTEQVNSATDHRALTGTWTQNVITGNTFDGIQLNGVTNGLLIGDPTLTSLGNTITSNKGSGVEVTGAGSVTIGSNLIETNGTLANLGTAANNAGILLTPISSSNITVENNTITNNLGDGVQYTPVSTGITGFPSYSVSIHDNQITDNSGRGINLINRDVYTQANIYNNFVSANKLEGVYIVNTASTDQTPWASSTTPLLADGSFFNNPRLELRIVNNQILGNGINSGLSGTGLVIRVGTSGGNYGFTNPGGFASTGAAILEGDPTNAVFGTSTTNGGVVAVVDDNALGGNFGNDVLFHSFTSTVNPITTTGTWSTTVFAVTAFQGDPLSRFDLYFRQNTTDPNAVDVVGSQTGGYAARNPALVAFYNNAEGTFKSNINTNTPAGPFTPQSATRARNATREAARIPQFNAPTVSPDGGTFLYPGMGPSTWRISADTASDSVDGAFFTNFTDISPYVNTVDARGANLGFIGNNGELPYGYGIFP